CLGNAWRPRDGGGAGCGHCICKPKDMRREATGNRGKLYPAEAVGSGAAKAASGSSGSPFLRTAAPLSRNPRKSAIGFPSGNGTEKKSWSAAPVRRTGDPLQERVGVAIPAGKAFPLLLGLVRPGVRPAPAWRRGAAAAPAG